MRHGRTPRVLACCGGMVVMGGLERMVFETLRAVSARGGIVHCVVNSWAHEQISAAAEKMGATWSLGSYRVRFERRPTSLAKVLAFAWDIAKTSAGLLTDAWRFRPTHVLVPEFTSVLRNGPALIVLRLAGVTVLLNFHNSIVLEPFYRRLWRFAVSPCVSRIVCVSRSSASQVIACGVPANKVCVIYNCLPPRPVAAVPAPERDYSKVIFVGQIIPDKNIHLLLDAIGILVARGIQVSLEIVGPMDSWVGRGQEGYREGLLRRAEAQDLKGRVRFLGWRDDVPALMRRAGVHCLPSVFEGLGLVVLEAKEAGLPTVAFKTGPFPELIEHRATGWLCDEVTPEALAEGLAFFVGRRERLVSTIDAVQASVRAFSFDAFSEQWWRLLDGPSTDRLPAPVDTSISAWSRRA